MSERTPRIPGRALAGLLVLGLVFGAGLLQRDAQSKIAQAQAIDGSRAQVVLDWFADRNHGDDAGAAALFTDSTFYVTASPQGTCTLQAPCYDAASALASLQASDAGHQCNTVTSIEVNGSIVTGRNEARNDLLRSRGIERAVGTFMAEVREGRLVSFYQRSDLADPGSALNAAITAGTAPPGTPLAAPTTPCAG